MVVDSEPESDTQAQLEQDFKGLTMTRAGEVVKTDGRVL